MLRTTALIGVLLAAIFLAACGSKDDGVTRTGPAYGEFPLIEGSSVIDEWRAPLFNYPERSLAGVLAEAPKGDDTKTVLAAQRKLLEDQGWAVGVVTGDEIVADANGDCDPRVFSSIGDDGSLAALDNEALLVADSPDESLRTIYYVGSAYAVPNIVIKYGRGPWPQLVQFSGDNKDAVAIVALTVDREFSRGILWANYADGFGEEAQPRFRSEACEADLAKGPFPIK